MDICLAGASRKGVGNLAATDNIAHVQRTLACLQNGHSLLTQGCQENNLNCPSSERLFQDINVVLINDRTRFECYCNC